jgi:hypothetical protein
MGWKLSVLVFLFAVWALSIGALIIGIPLLVYLFYGFWSKRKTRATAPNRKSHVSRTTYLGLAFLFLTFVAFANGGVVSPIVFGSLSIATSFYGKRFTLRPFAGLILVDGSVLLRDRLLAFRWFAVTEVKLATRDAARALSALDGTLVFRLDGQVRAYLVSKSTALSVRAAEQDVASRLRELSKILTPLGAYLMPLSVKEALDVVYRPAERVRFDKGELVHNLATSSFDLLAVHASGQNVEKLGAYRTMEGRKRIIFEGPPCPKPFTVWEVASIIGRRGKWTEPDDLTVFLSSLAATRGASAGEKLVNVGNAESQILLVRSVRTAPVELDRGRLRLLKEIYS